VSSPISRSLSPDGNRLASAASLASRSVLFSLGETLALTPWGGSILHVFARLEVICPV